MSRNVTDPGHCCSETVRQVFQRGQISLESNQVLLRCEHTCIAFVEVHSSSGIMTLLMCQPHFRTTRQQPITDNQLNTLHTHTHTHTSNKLKTRYSVQGQKDGDNGRSLPHKFSFFKNFLLPDSCLQMNEFAVSNSILT